MSDTPVWVGAIATGATFLLVGGEFVVELRRRARARTREQAERITAWQGGTLVAEVGNMPVRLLNSSQDAVYGIVVTAVLLVQGGGVTRGEDRGDGTHTILNALPPGRWDTTAPGGDGGMHQQWGVEVAFTDRAGRHWIRRANGRLERLRRKAPWAHYNFELPFTMSFPTEVI